MKANTIASLPFRIFSIFLIALVGLLIAALPMMFLAYAELDKFQLPNLTLETEVFTRLAFSATYVVFCAVLYLAFTMGTGRVSN